MSFIFVYLLLFDSSIYVFFFRVIICFIFFWLPSTPWQAFQFSAIFWRLVHLPLDSAGKYATEFVAMGILCRHLNIVPAYDRCLILLLFPPSLTCNDFFSRQFSFCQNENASRDLPQQQFGKDLNALRRQRMETVTKPAGCIGNISEEKRVVK